MNIVLRKIKRWSKRSKILAVSDDSIEKWLDSLGILDKVKGGKVNCFVCKGTIDIDSIELISRAEGEIVLICDKPECMKNFYQNNARN